MTAEGKRMHAEPSYDRYYSIHLSRWPFGLFCRQVWRHVPHLAPLLIPILMLQRIPGLRPAPAFACIYPEDFTPITLEQLPQRARTPLESRIREAEELGFHLCHCFALETLGPYEQYDVTLLDETGTITIQFRWYETQRDNRTEQDSGIFCASSLADGGALSSIAIAKRNVIPEMRLPDDQQRHYPETTSVEDLVRLHREAIPEHAQLRHYDCDSLLARYRERSKQLLDTLLERRIYFELTPQQIQKLKEQDAKRQQFA